MGEVNSEHIHVGRALKAHRELLGIDLVQMYRARPMGAAFDIRWCESAQKPSAQRIRWYHDTLITAYTAAGSEADVPFGRREQWWDTALDRLLWQDALEIRRGVHWWWAPRQLDGRMGALCYLCTTMIHTYDIKSGATHPMRVAVMEHRDEHWRRLHPQPAIGQNRSTA